MLVALKGAGCDVCQLEYQESSVTASVQIDHLLYGHTLPVFFANDQSHQQAAAATHRIADWYLIHMRLRHALDVVSCRI